MKKTSSKSNSAEALATGAGGLSDQKAKPQPLPSLAPEETPKPSSALAQPENSPSSIQPSNQPSNSGKANALTGGKGSTIPNSTLAGTAHWVLTQLRNRHLIRFVLNETEGRYEAHFPVSTWKLIGNNVLTLTEEAK